MKFIDWFAGIGGFRRGMELAGHECVGFCEFDKYAVVSYTAMHLLTDEQRSKLMSMEFRQRQEEILKEEYRNSEWYASDVRRVYAGDIPAAECWCFGFPCQDISICGAQLGIQGSRSSLFFRIMYLLGQLSEEERPKYLFIENVKNLLGVNGGWDFARLLSAMDEGGYDAEWEVFNSRDFGIPQNRERVFVIGRFRGDCSGEVLLPTVASGQNNVGIKQIGRDGSSSRNNPNQYRVYDKDGISPTLNKMDGGGRVPMIVDDGRLRKLTPKECFRLQGWDDMYYERAAQFNSDSQLYKQAGNGVTVNVIQAIAEKLA